MMNIITFIVNKDNKTSAQYNQLVMTMYNEGEDDFPRLKGKAAEVKHFASALLHVFRKHMNRDQEDHNLINYLLTLVIKLDSILDDNKLEYKLPENQAQEFKNCCLAFVQTNARLRHICQEQRRMLFHFTIKFHYILHIGLKALHINPGLGSCIKGEAMVQVVMGIAQSCHFGAPSHLAVNKIMDKYSFGLGMHCVDKMWK